MNSRKITYCLLFVFLALAGPRPIFHSHDRLLELADAKRQLAQHLSTFHQNDSKPVPANQFHVHWIGSDYCCTTNSIPTDCCNHDLVASQLTLSNPGQQLDDSLQLLFESIGDALFEHLTLVVDDLQSSFDQPQSFGSFESSRERLQHLCVWTC